MGNHERGSGSGYFATQEYGAGDAKIGSIVNGTARDGKRIKQSFFKNVPAFAKLSKELEKEFRRYGHIKALDGSHLNIRGEHKILNTALQSDATLVAKASGLFLEDRLYEMGLEHHVEGDYYFCVFSHDEYQIACRSEDTAQTVGRTFIQAVKDAQENYEVQCELGAEYKIGRNWADTH